MHGKGSKSETSDRLRSVSWTSDKFPPPGLGLARVAHQVGKPWLLYGIFHLFAGSPSISYLSYQQDQLPPSISPGFRDVVSGVVPLLQVTSFSIPQIGLYSCLSNKILLCPSCLSNSALRHINAATTDTASSPLSTSATASGSSLASQLLCRGQASHF